jgi:hypothetical protein
VCPTSPARPPTRSGNPPGWRLATLNPATSVRVPGGSAEHPPQDSPSLPFVGGGLPTKSMERAWKKLRG